jgi:molybdopterin-synthase adenylyltransferase
MKIRIKPGFHLLQRNDVVECIKTLNESVKLPAGDFFDAFLATIQNMGEGDDAAGLLATKFGLPPAMAQQFFDKLFELGVIEYYIGAPLPDHLRRYHRQLLLFDSMAPQTRFEDNFARQEKLSNVHVLVLGVGGIGNFIAMSLVAAGVGKITLVDPDTVELTNLNRQVLFDESTLGASKSAAATARLKLLNNTCDIQFRTDNITDSGKLSQLLSETGKVDYLVLSADHPVELVLWASGLCRTFGFKYLKCGYMAYEGLIGPLLGPATLPYETLFQSWASDIAAQPEGIQHQNNLYTAPSMAATNAILANIAALELIKDATELVPSVLLEKRLLFNLKTMEMYYG